MQRQFGLKGYLISTDLMCRWMWRTSVKTHATSLWLGTRLICTHGWCQLIASINLTQTLLKDSG